MKKLLTPHVSFSTSKDLDKWKVVSFLRRSDTKGGHDFSKIILKAHPKLGEIEDIYSDEGKKAILSYVDAVYEAHPGISKTVVKMQNEWDKLSSEFYQITNNIFKNTNWPKGEYIAYATVSPPMPRFLHNKTFQVGYNKNGSWKQTVAHELLHFIFYEFVRKTYTPNLSDTLEKKMNTLLQGKFQIPLWDLSEVLNVMLLGIDQYQKLFPYPSVPYPGHKKYLKLSLSLWDKANHNINKFLKGMES